MANRSHFALATAIVASSFVASPLDAQPVVGFHLPAQPLAKSLEDVAHAANTNILFDPAQVRGRQAPALDGQFTTERAIEQLIAGQPLAVKSTGSGTWIVTGSTPQGNTVGGSDGPNATAAGKAPEDTAEIVVTGTNIRGAANGAAPLDSYKRSDIDLSGTGSVQQFLKRIPENFGGGASDETLGTLAGGGNAVNAVNGAGVNLRGLGSDATLVLIDGHRIAPANNSGNFVDLSMIPLSIVSRVDVLPDGASAIYGSDAVGGVVNLVLRRDFDGEETRARFGTTSDGGGQEVEAAQTIGRTWSGGSGLITYDYDHRSAIDSSDRDYANGNPSPFTLVPRQNKNALFASLRQAIGRGIELFGEGLWSHRTSSSDLTYVGIGNQHNAVNATNVGGTAGLTADLGGDRRFELSSTYDASRTDQNNSFLGEPTAHVHTRATVLTIDGKMDGTLFTWAAGPVRFAIGGQYREESLDSTDLIAGSVYSPRRRIEAGFGELDVPLVGKDQPLGPVDLSLADRAEHYSDFGSTNNPKIGLSWRPTPGLKLRGTYATSFRAPLLSDLNPIPFQVVALQEPDPVTGGNSNVLVVFGGNPDLKPEKSRNWTLGVDVEHGGLRASATYYNIRFSNLITTAQTAGFDLFDALDNAAMFGPLLVRNPPLPTVTGFVNSTQEFDDFTGIPGGVDLSTISALVDSRSVNLSSLNTNGIDFKISYDADIRLIHFEVGLDGTYILNFKERVAPATGRISVLNTQYNPVDLKLRGRVLASRGNFRGAIFLNYVDSYRDVRSSPPVPISSWTTLDAALQYDLHVLRDRSRPLTLGLNVNNLFNKAPPYVATPAPGLAPGLVFDGANANVWGRLISMQLTARW